MAINVTDGSFVNCNVGISVPKNSQIDVNVIRPFFKDVGTGIEERDAPPEPPEPLVQLMLQCFEGRQVDIKEFAQLLRDVGLAPKEDQRKIALESNIFGKLRHMALDVSTFASNVVTVASHPHIAPYIAKLFAA